MLVSSSSVRRLGLLLFLLLMPLLTRADALDGAMLMLELLAAVAGIALTGVVLTVLAYARPQSRALRVLNYVVAGLNIVLGMLWEQVFSRSALDPIFLGINPFLSVAVPLALWLGGVTWAREEQKPLRQLVWVSVAVFGAQLLINPVVQQLMWSVVGQGTYTSGGISWLGWGLSLLLSFACWWLVLEQVQRQWQLGWQAMRPRLLAPALEAGFGLVFSIVSVLMMLGPGDQLANPGSYWTSLLGGAVLSWAVGVLAVWLNQRRYAAPAPLEE
ncbi:hypothetical protein E5K00_20505 [Hymenobacter aquaticus]|uniref:Uncharacterized protein n=1 Tax=Hymenobacter aquaticus TaxID=1867101 RepID=A0A4Z0PSU8_9BACT|nr:hypothetical protein [Hymenobacter aquaticus]TGE20384.1 hypothetical protein E5K00_20505 [Hymenobacter aquaticus]